jgi:23S rRNA (adenine2503-C2)-methyltransferase
LESASVFDLSLSELEHKVVEWGYDSYRARQIWHGLYRTQVRSFHAIRTIPKPLRTKLSHAYRFQSLKLVQLVHSSDQRTTKALFEISPGKHIETVLMGFQRRQTACVSSQAGCAMGCPFCATGKLGLQTQLTSGQIVEQAMFFAQQLKENDLALTNIVLMGMGEPFHNYEATTQALDRLSDPRGFAFGARRLTVSTVGIIPGIDRFIEDSRRENLAVSLHAADNDLRNELVPVNTRYPLHDLIAACRRYVERSRRRISFEWALIDGVNDGLEQARKLSHLLRDFICHVNLIPLNPTVWYHQRRSADERMFAFRDYLKRKGIPCTIRISRGVEIQAGCGQLAAEFDHP